MNRAYEFIYIKIYYACGHEAIRPVLSMRAGTRTRCTDQRCSHCEGLREHRYATAREVQKEQAEEVGV
jgi:hypothetical protein